MTAEPPAAMKSLATRIDAALQAFLEEAPMADRLRQAVQHAALGGGKRLRPVLTLCGAAAAGGDPDEAMPAAVAVELVHTFSLVHDDLPAMDDDELRRGRPTVHVAFGEAMGVLAGDMLLTLAFQALASAGDPAVQGRLASELASGTGSMITGQVYDTLGGTPGGLSERERLSLIHRQKTSALIRAAARMGVLSVSPDSSGGALGPVTAYSEAIGLMFQIVDDLLDVEQSTDHLGKAANKDSGAGKTTYPGVLGVEASRREIERLRSEALESIAGLGPRAEFLRDICQYLAVRTR